MYLNIYPSERMFKHKGITSEGTNQLNKIIFGRSILMAILQYKPSSIYCSSDVIKIAYSCAPVRRW